jgi:hypothetical protein
VINYLPYIIGFVSLLGGIYLFIISFNLYQPNFRTKERQDRFFRTLTKFGFYLKFISLILIINGFYNLFYNDIGIYNIGSQTVRNSWTPSIKRDLINNCMTEIGQKAKDYPAISHKYCKCAMSKIADSISYEKYIEIIRKPKNERINAITTIVSDCLTEFHNKIEEQEKNQSSR